MSILEKISSYNIITSLVPGLILLEALRTCDVPFLGGNENLTAWLILGYALGSISARIGSLVVDPALSRLTTYSRSSYGDFIEASASDPKIDILVETGNTYRGIVGASVLFFIIFFAYPLMLDLQLGRRCMTAVSAFSVCILFTISYVKQRKYVEARVGHRNSGSA